MAAAKKPEPPPTPSKYPSPYGSHTSMVDADATKALDKLGRVVCQDERGLYETAADRLDSGLADTNRFQWRNHPKGDVS